MQNANVDVGWVSLATPVINVQQPVLSEPRTARRESLNSVVNQPTPVSVPNVSMKSVSEAATETPSIEIGEWQFQLAK